jgi:hypothetical protein
VEGLEIQVGKLKKEVKRMKRVDAEQKTRVLALEEMVKKTNEVGKEQKERVGDLQGKILELEGRIGEEAGIR